MDDDTVIEGHSVWAEENEVHYYPIPDWAIDNLRTTLCYAQPMIPLNIDEQSTKWWRSMRDSCINALDTIESKEPIENTTIIAFRKASRIHR